MPSLCVTTTHNDVVFFSDLNNIAFNQRKNFAYPLLLSELVMYSRESRSHRSREPETSRSASGSRRASHPSSPGTIRCPSWQRPASAPERSLEGRRQRTRPPTTRTNPAIQHFEPWGWHPPPAERGARLRAVTHGFFKSPQYHPPSSRSWLMSKNIAKSQACVPSANRMRETTAGTKIACPSMSL